jgi:hypothetical protein
MRLDFGRRGSEPAAYEPLKSPFNRPHGGPIRNTVDMTFATMCFIVLGLIGVSSLSFMAGQHLQTATLSDILNRMIALKAHNFGGQSIDEEQLNPLPKSSHTTASLPKGQTLLATKHGLTSSHPKAVSSNIPSLPLHHPPLPFSTNCTASTASDTVTGVSWIWLSRESK